MSIDAMKLRGRGRLPSPPADAHPHLVPETPPPATPEPPAATVERHDGRHRRRTGRTSQFNTRISVEFDQRIRAIADEDGMLIVEVLEAALAVYEKSRAKLRKS